ncbi:MAG TPA: TraB/GumN family protein, partial [Chitinophagaceae bacterium]|nr:TraB/GumN family protein [Chitinophagaceae bacterium]
MKRTLVLLFALIPALLLAQTTPKKNKYPSLLWEISGNGLTKPSYLFGTMHVSSKIAFHLADSFYVGIRQADVVALETNPESWQEDMTQYETGQQEAAFNRRFGGYRSVPNDYLSINTLKFYKYDKKIERSLYSSPSAINNLLYRSYGNETSDFEEDTYLDMYIYQCGKKWGKQVAGVEKYGESMKLMQEAYRDAMRDKNKKNRNYEVDEEYSAGRLQEAYRKGNLDLLDSINKLNSFSDAFDEKFLYRRNEIQAASIDSILKTRSTLFVGVGAAHLPGSRGVIEILRQMGYRLRPILMNERDSRHKEEVEKLRVPVSFREETASDGLFTVSIPGKFYVFGEDGALEQQQYADMANGSYYMVTRVMTNAWMWGHDQQDVMKKIDSLLYENIPGKILSKTSINRNGYAGFDILNKTRRGDLQRYNIFVTPFEVIFFKMSGTGDYVKNGDEANKFFSSIRFRDYRSKTGTGAPVWKKFSPSYGGFSIEMPHQPYTGNDGSWIYDAEDRETGQHYRVIRSDIHNYHFAEEDSFDLGLMEESFAASEFIDKQLSRKKSHFKGYPALDCKYRDKNGSTYLARFIIQGPHYYTLVAHGKKETARMQEFLNSFEIKPFVYPQAKAYTDSSLYFSVISPVVPDSKKQRLDIPRFNFLRSSEEDEEKAEDDLLEEGTYRNKIIGNDSTGEKILVSFYKYPRYYYRADSTDSNLDEDISVLGDSSWIVKSKKSYQLPGSMKVHEVLVTDTGSSRAIWSKKFYKDGARFSLLTELDTLTAPSAFLRSFFESFAPADTLKAVNLYSKKSGLFFSDFMSKDSIAHKRAVKSIDLIELDSTDLPALKKAIGSLGFEEKNYLDIKKELIGKLDELT